ncbi:efflux RND transporter permease subunit [Longimicrobium terrae]|uniref:HAE1 family hydrophobic/amphiphilic exporter-1 n=1 Tax=Longimicrobium terrae TaxID=1639882 RepID=A0A841H101_9BACT|nr:efflux RND transporter permease subunit [Longimicrobium terrae]MBB4637285.1 HAE1 family hydrophobic/amphiphilic exporter-1 [Longimicrobium terrae]MBB6071683.1 HAE1 family hydrophobic/amphiphilic exporter-1 [Longimicrobium terrae]NNC28444.1 efflux RND transporter permease subunit [Longimicrobium terrae]
MFLSDVSIRRPVFATMMMVTLVVLGLAGYQRLAVDEYPDVAYPTVVAQTSYPGASPQVMEREVSRPIEEALNTVQGIDEITSTSLEGSSLVRVQLKLGVDVMDAQQEVQSKIARIRRQLPEDIDDPVIIRFDPNERAIMSIAVQSSGRSMRELTDLADQVISTRLEALSGVGGVNLVGGTERQIRVQLDPASMRSYGIAPPQVAQALQRENQEVPAGRVRRGDQERLVRITGRVEDPKTFQDVTVAVRNGVPVRLGDVGSVVDGTAEARSASFLNDGRALSIEILKISGSNTVEVADRVRAAVAEMQRQLPSDVKMTVVTDDSRRIKESLASVQHELALGAVLCIAIIYLFLNSWRSTIITGLALPISIISAYFGMWMFGFTINTMTLLALSLAIGLLIDDAIVVRENIVRHVEMGKDHHTAAREGTSEIGLAVFSTTLAVVAVFVPVAFMGGQIGMIFFQFGVVVAFAVMISLFVSFTLDPMLSSVWPDPEVENHEGRRRNPIQRFARRFNDGFERIADRYPAWLAWALDHRKSVLGGATAAVVASMLIIPQLGFAWVPDFDGGEFNVNFRVAPGSRLEYTVARGHELSDLLRKQPEVEFTYMSIGGGFRGTPNTGRVFVKLKEKSDRKRNQMEITEDLRGALRNLPGIRANITGTPTIFGGFRQPIQVNVQGPEQQQLKLAAAQVMEILESVPGLAEATSSDDGEIPQLDVNVDREQAWAAGVGISSIATTLQPLFTGQRATEWEDAQGYTHDVVVVYPDSMRTSAADVGGIVVPSTNVDPASGRPVMIPLSQVATVQAGVGPQQIERSSLERQISISAGVTPGYPMSEVADAARAALDSAGLPTGYRTVFRGDVQNLNETKGYVLSALGLAVIFIYIVLASLFGSFLQPLAIMLSLPLSFIGVGLALLLTGGNLNVFTMIGIIMLMGLVTKNGILLIDFANQQREEGMGRREALLSAGRIRLRPIIMTTVAMIFGMVPLALALGEGAEQRAPMGRAVIGGLITSTVLTLFVVPVVYTLLDDFVGLLRRRGKRSAQSHAPHAPVRPEPVAAD